MPDTGNAKDCTHKFFDFYSIELVSLIWFLQLSCNLCLWYYDQLVHCNKEINIVMVTESILNVSTVYLNGIWHLIGRYLSKPVLGGHPSLYQADTTAFPEGVRLIQVSL